MPSWHGPVPCWRFPCRPARPDATRWRCAWWQRTRCCSGPWRRRLAPRPFPDAGRLAILSPATLFLNAAALQALGLQADRGSPVTLRQGLSGNAARIAGTVSAAGPPLAVMDIGAAQDFFGRAGRLSRIDVQLQPGRRVEDFQAALPQMLQAAGLEAADAAGLAVVRPQDTARRTDDLSRAYRVNLTVLALVALFTGGYLVFSVLALSVARRSPQFALLAVLGATPRMRRALVLAESAALGVAGSVAGIALGTGLAALALRAMGGDLGGGYFEGVRPSLQWSAGAALLYAALGTAAALAGAGGPRDRRNGWRRPSLSKGRARPPTCSPGWHCPRCAPRRGVRWHSRHQWRGCRSARTRRSRCCWWAASACCRCWCTGC